MSRKAFDMLMEGMTAEDQADILKIAMTYGLDPTSPEWIPFAVSQHGLRSIDKGKKAFAKDIEDGASNMLRQAMNAMDNMRVSAMQQQDAATKLNRQSIENDAAKARQVIGAYADTKQTAMVNQALTSFSTEAGRIVTTQIVALDRATTALAKEMDAARERMSAIRQISLTHIIGGALTSSVAGACMVVALMWVFDFGKAPPAQPAAQVSAPAQQTPGKHR